MVGVLLNEVIDEENSATHKRDKLIFAMQIMFGCRVGEVVGDGHGMLAANNLVILRKLDANGEPTGEETLEGMLPHTKSTELKRFVNALGTSRGPANVKFAQILREYWEAAGFPIVQRKEAGFLVEGPSYYVVKISLVALAKQSSGDAARLALLVRTLKNSKVAQARKFADYIALRGGERLRGDSLNKKYVNVMGMDSATSVDSDQLILELAKAGFAEKGRVVIEAGPLIRATHGPLGHTHLPLSVSSTYAPLHRYFDEAIRRANPPGDPDRELDLQGRDFPKFGHHSDRRCADSVARQTRQGAILRYHRRNGGRY